MLAASDAGAAALTVTAAMLLRSGTHASGRVAWGLAAVPLTIVLFKLYGLYDRDVKRITHTTVDDLPAAFHAIMVETLTLWLYSKATPMGKLDFAQVMTFALGTLGLVVLGRLVVRIFSPRLLGFEKALLLGGGRMADALATKLANHPEYGCSVVGVLRDPEEGNGERQGLPVLGTRSDLAAVAARCGASRVFVAGAGEDEAELEELLRRCRAMSLKVSLLPQLSDVLGSGVEVDDVEGVMVLGVNPPWLPRSSRAVKRALDLAIALPAVLILSPLALLLALAIRLDSPGPALFKQVRVGRGGRRIRVLKFRTMVADAERLRAQLLSQSKDPNWLHLDRDPRITRIGRLLRLSSIDELPQLWNVVRGEMSLVGPRPLAETEDRMVQGWGRGRLDLTPGITGYWQVLGRTRIPFEEMVKLDYLYVMNWSLWEDIRLMLRTVPAVVAGRGVN